MSARFTFFDETGEKHLSITGDAMRKILLTGTTVLVLCVLLSAPTVSNGQYYGYYQYYYPQQLPPPPSYYYGNPQGIQQYYKRWTPNKNMYRGWDYHNRMEDYQKSIRSPLNPESDLDYMLRTF